MVAEYPPISMTVFTDFVSKSGTPKATVVRNWKYRPQYSPATDYYKALREAITEYHSTGAESDSLEQAVRVAPLAKQENYRLLAQQYRKWSEARAGAWLGASPVSNWRSGAVVVRVNPEVTLKIGEDTLYVKLFLKAGGLKKSQASLILELMTSTLARHKPGVVCVVLDVRHGKEFSARGSVPELLAQLKAEAAYWATLWTLI